LQRNSRAKLSVEFGVPVVLESGERLVDVRPNIRVVRPE
jgi:hypothetical protein